MQNRFAKVIVLTISILLTKNINCMGLKYISCEDLYHRILEKLEFSETINLNEIWKKILNFTDKEIKKITCYKKTYEDYTKEKFIPYDKKTKNFIFNTKNEYIYEESESSQEEYYFSPKNEKRCIRLKRSSNNPIRPKKSDKRSRNKEPKHIKW
ncbi:hypothetical protein GF385_01420 [Candidatus Dependentiae bacterium]|nr:hypothetical protein [Candidatus Dependentiae bacterium]